MNRSLSILFTLITVTVLVSAPAGAQKEGPGLTIKKDGDFVVLIPQEPGQTFLVLGIPSKGKGQESMKGLPGHLTFLAEETKFPVKDYASILVWGLGQAAEMDMDQLILRSRAKPFPPGCPPRCPELEVYLICGGAPCGWDQWEGVGDRPEVKIP